VSLLGPNPVQHILSDATAVVCNDCIKLLDTISSLEKNLASLKTDIMTRISALQQPSDCTQSSSAAGEKRPSSMPHTQLPQAKHMRVDLDTGSQQQQMSGTSPQQPVSDTRLQLSPDVKVNSYQINGVCI